MSKINLPVVTENGKPPTNSDSEIQKPSTNQSLNHVRGDLAGKDINKNSGDVNNVTAVIVQAIEIETPLSRLYQKLNNEVAADQKLNGFIRELQIFTRKARTDPLSDLETKLSVSNRQSEIEMAMELKEWVYGELKENLFSPTFQQIYSILLGKVYEEFNHHVRPAVLGEEPKAVIDNLIKLRVVDPIAQELDECPDFSASSHTLIRSLIYFLAGNCHLYWRTQ